MTTSAYPGPHGTTGTGITVPDRPAPQPGRAAIQALIDSHHANRPYVGTPRGDALDELAWMIGLIADDFDRTVAESARRLTTARQYLDTIAAGGAITPSNDQPVLATASASLDILTAIANTHTHHLRLLGYAYQRLNTQPGTGAPASL